MAISGRRRRCDNVPNTLHETLEKHDQVTVLHDYYRIILCKSDTEMAILLNYRMKYYLVELIDAVRMLWCSCLEMK